MLRVRITEQFARQSIDRAVYDSVARFGNEFGEQQSLVMNVAKAACESALEQFAAMCNHELRLIEVEWERKADLARLTPAQYMIKKNEY